MAIAAFLANQLLPLTTALSVVTLFIGLSACPMESAELQHLFVVLSAVTLAGLLASFVWHMLRRKVSERGFKLAFGMIPLALLWAALLVPCQTVREGSARTMMILYGKDIGLAAHYYFDDNRRLPNDLCDPAGLPMLSWRVSICPYIDASPLHKQFDLTKAWDSQANRPLVEKMPSTFHSLLFHEKPGHTPWQGFVGPGTAFEPGQALNLLRDFPDGTSYTILVVEAQQHVPWTKPGDIPYGPNIPLPPLGQQYMRRGDWPFCCPVRGNPVFHACMMDGTVRSFAGNMPEETLRALIVRNDGGPKKDVFDD